MKPTPVLTAHAHWIWAMLGIPKSGRPKLVENRSRTDGRIPPMCKHRGALLLHASQNREDRLYENAFQWMAARDLVVRDVPGPRSDLPRLPHIDALQRGGIVGRCRVIAHVTPDGEVFSEPDGSGDPWADEDPRFVIHGIDMIWHMPKSWGLVFADVEELPFVACSGSQGLWLPECSDPTCGDPTRRTKAGDRPAVATFLESAGRLLCQAHKRFDEKYCRSLGWSTEHYMPLTPTVETK